jgi:hypothetical protein
MTIEVVPCPHPGCVDLRDVLYPDDVLHLTSAEWVEFLAAVKRGDFDALTGPAEII